jgi:NAD(P)-dependent dehydrogenase (short-subunit alcohol dehydrogenase family)
MGALLGAEAPSPRCVRIAARRATMARRAAGTRKPPGPLAGQIAIVAGATRGAGRGIARGLGEAGALVYCTGRSVRGKPSPYQRSETIDETAEMINDAGGKAVAVRVDHTIEAEVAALVARVRRAHRRLDIVVNCIAGEDPLMTQWGSFWDADFTHADAVFRQALTSHLITAKHAARAMIKARRGLIVEVTESDIMGAGGNPMSQTVKLALKAGALNMAAELKPHGVAAVAVTPGFLRSEKMLENFGVTEDNWRDGGKTDRNFLESETPLYLGRGVAALAADPRVMDRTGQLLSSWELSRLYGVADVDGRRPDWGRLKIDWSGLPPFLLQLFHDGTELQLAWLKDITRRTKNFARQLPR